MAFGKSLLRSTAVLTASSLLMRSMGMLWQVWLAGRIGAAGMGLFQLAANVGFLFATLAVSGIRFSVTRLLSEELGRGNEGCVRAVAARGFCYAAFFGIAAGLLLWLLAEPVGFLWVGDARSVRPLRYMALALPAASLSAVAAGYFTAVGRVWKTAAEQITEQLFRMALVILLLRGVPAGNIERGCAAVIGAGAVADTLGALALFALYLFDRRRYAPEGGCAVSLTPRLLHLAAPLALSAYARSALNTVRQLLTPKGLRLSGLSADAALAGYGIVTGMVMPVLTFPTCLPAALAELLVPALTEAEVSGEWARIRRSVRRLLTATFALSCAAAAFFFVSADWLSGVLYKSDVCARFLRVYAPMVPFLYTDIVTDGCLKGLGQMMRSMAYNIAEAALGLFLISFLLPRYALAGYAAVLYVCEIFNFTLSLRRLIVLLREKR